MKHKCRFDDKMIPNDKGIVTIGIIGQFLRCRCFDLKYRNHGKKFLASAMKELSQVCSPN
ncbi:hypothetical protein EK904_003011 [Melospiza melodia maxima]|nr:hypothetical protein EK904_003011 [Melospiza melodia maxima]